MTKSNFACCRARNAICIHARRFVPSGKHLRLHCSIFTIRLDDRLAAIRILQENQSAYVNHYTTEHKVYTPGAANKWKIDPTKNSARILVGFRIYRLMAVVNIIESSFGNGRNLRKMFRDVEVFYNYKWELSTTERNNLNSKNLDFRQILVIHRTKREFVWILLNGTRWTFLDLSSWCLMNV